MSEQIGEPQLKREREREWVGGRLEGQMHRDSS